MQNVYKLCTVSTCMHSVHRLHNGFSKRNLYTSTQAPSIDMVFVYTYSYTCMRIRAHARIRIRVYVARAYTRVRVSVYMRTRTYLEK